MSDKPKLTNEELADLKEPHRFNRTDIDENGEQDIVAQDYVEADVGELEALRNDIFVGQDLGAKDGEYTARVTVARRRDDTLEILKEEIIKI